MPNLIGKCYFQCHLFPHDETITSNGEKVFCGGYARYSAARPRCFIPRFDGVILSLECKEALWDKFVMGAPRSSHDAPLVQAPWRGHAIRAAIQRSQASLAVLSKEFGINAKTVAKWRKRSFVDDLKTGPTKPRSTVLTETEEAMIIAFRRHTLLPLDDCLYALQSTLPHLTRSALHRCLQRHGISRLPDVGGDKPARQRFKRYPIGFFHIDIAEVQTTEGKLHLFVAIDRTSKFAVTQLAETADRRTAWEFLQHVLEVVPYKIHTILTDNGIQFAEQTRNRNTIYSRQMRFDMICQENGIEHRLTKPNHPWTNGQVEIMYRTIKDTTVKRYHYDSHDQLRKHLADFILRRGQQSTGLLAIPSSHTTLGADSRPSAASPLTNISARYGHPNQSDSF